MASIYTPRLELAVRVAARAHRKQLRKGSETPYIVHPFSVMMIASSATDDEDTLIAALFHDILEDVPDEYTEAQMRQDFGGNVVAIVQGVTKNDAITDWHERSRAYADNLRRAPEGSVIVSGADKIHNLMSTLNDYEAVGDEIWQVFSTGNAPDQLWWYELILQVLRERQAPERLIVQLSELIERLRLIVGPQHQNT